MAGTLPSIRRVQSSSPVARSRQWASMCLPTTVRFSVAWTKRAASSSERAFAGSQGAIVAT